MSAQRWTFFSVYYIFYRRLLNKIKMLLVLPHMKIKGFQDFLPPWLYTCHRINILPGLNQTFSLFCFQVRHMKLTYFCKLTIFLSYFVLQSLFSCLGKNRNGLTHSWVIHLNCATRRPIYLIVYQFVFKLWQRLNGTITS